MPLTPKNQAIVDRYSEKLYEDLMFAAPETWRERIAMRIQDAIEDMSYLYDEDSDDAGQSRFHGTL